MPIRILIAEDNETVRSRVADMLGSHEGWTICAAVQDGHEAVAKAKELTPDLIVLDLAMPMIDGLSATREILRTLPTVPIVIYTLHNIPSIELEAKKAGARKMVLKPNVHLLISAMEEILANEATDSTKRSSSASADTASQENPIVYRAEQVLANKPEDSAVPISAAPASDAAIPATASAPTADGAQTNAASSDGETSAPPAMGEPDPSA